ncbi:hypothetical protein [Mycobacteroides abscessus]|uniref:hypothetical protein n=1 Tax=Mycobacteroides abscessus TaxID=36809 RepID=UPI0009A71315|nr:hypothetical protein [Mycobacteroides abscessus]MBE5471348.1 hypothetical protein [Mycobacteroides abscessus]SKH02097.1 Uncharacterised protein [Mycobacteroides abscessus subsp. massiliense]SKH51983.1 Uncharacterised protein [Mycobacteroides abscessus subsp. massiliense]SKI07632.1 Uncharacterised protein [Mycobacteroides abscessus subsp. massiliense]SKJ33888.1 Uncharacterised protein [Mycobacteroides abscessus subsp. massiliense]
MRNVRWIGAVAVAGAMCVAGCGGGSTTEIPPSIGSSSETQAVAPAKPVQNLVLTAAELPPGLTVTPIEADEKQAILDQLTGSADEGATFTPAECRLPSMFEPSTPVDASKLGVVVGEAGRGYFNEAVVAQRPAVAQLRTFLDTCKTVRETHGGTSIETTYTVLDGVRSKADELVVLHEQVPGVLVKQDAYTAYASVAGHAVWVRMRTLGGDAPDRPLFDQLVTASIDKVAAAR